MKEYYGISWREQFRYDNSVANFFKGFAHFHNKYTPQKEDNSISLDDLLMAQVNHANNKEKEIQELLDERSHLGKCIYKRLSNLIRDCRSSLLSLEQIQPSPIYLRVQWQRLLIDLELSQVKESVCCFQDRLRVCLELWKAQDNVEKIRQPYELLKRHDTN